MLQVSIRKAKWSCIYVLYNLLLIAYGWLYINTRPKYRILPKAEAEDQCFSINLSLVILEIPGLCIGISPSNICAKWKCQLDSWRKEHKPALSIQFHVNASLHISNVISLCAYCLLTANMKCKKGGGAVLSEDTCMQLCVWRMYVPMHVCFLLHG